MMEPDKPGSPFFCLDVSANDTNRRVQAVERCFKLRGFWQDAAAID
jgi:hypothetical protein